MKLRKKCGKMYKTFFLDVKNDFISTNSGRQVHPSINIGEAEI